jgi:hypothetical protein
LAFAPRTAIHAIGAYLYLSPDADRPDAEVAATLEETDPRDLLRAAIPDAPPRLYRALDRAGDRVHEREFYERLALLSGSPLADNLLSGGPLNDSRLNRVEVLLAMDPVILSLPGIWNRPTYEIEATDTLIQFLRGHEALRDGDLQIPKGGGLPAVLRRLQNALDRIEAPIPEFSLRAPFRIVRSVGELRDLGRTLENCLWGRRLGGTGHWFRLVEGTTVYVVGNAPPLLAAVQRAGRGLWKVDEVSGLQNENIGGDVREFLDESLRAAGVRIVRNMPSDALLSLSNIRQLNDCEDAPDAE